MIICLDEDEYLNINTITRISLVQDVLRITFLNGDTEILYNKEKIQKILDKLKSISV